MLQSTKICTKCKTEKSLGEFHNKKVNKDGKNNLCKACKKEQAHEYYVANMVRENAKSIAYQRLNREKCIETGKKYRERNLERLKAKSNSYKKAHPEYIKEYNSMYRETNKEKAKVEWKKYYEKNKLQLCQSHREHHKNNPQVRKEYNQTQRRKDIAKTYRKSERGRVSERNMKHKRRTLTKQGDVTTEQLLTLKNTAKTCFYCDCDLTIVKAHIDHLVPLARGGEHTISNLVMACATCNTRKGAKDPMEFIWSSIDTHTK